MLVPARRANLFGLVVALVVCGSQVTALAQAEDQRDRAAARALFHEGLDAATDKDWSTAADRFERALQLQPSAVVTYNLAAAWTHLDRLVEASALFEQLLKAPHTDDELRGYAQEQLTLLQGRIPKLTVEMRARQPGDELRIDDAPIPEETLGVPTPADPGDKRITVTRAGEVIYDETLLLEEGAQVVHRIELPAPAPAVPTPAEVAAGAGAGADADPVDDAALTRDDGDEDSLWASPWLWTGVGATVAAAVIVTLLAGGEDTDGPRYAGSLQPGNLEVKP